MDEQARAARMVNRERGFEEAFGESLRAVLDLESWSAGEDLDVVYERVAREYEAAVRQEARVRNPIRELVFPRIREHPGAPPGAGVYRAELERLKQIHQGLLFTGGVEACESTLFAHETLPLTITQIGVSLVSYSGNLGTWVQRLFRRDLREAIEDPAGEALALLERRSAQGASDSQEDLNRLARRAITTYAERAVLLHRSSAAWRLGRGNPAPYELLTGTAGTLDLMIEATKVLEELICQHRKFVFVPREVTGRALHTIGAALDPLEYAIVERLSDNIADVVATSQYYLPTSSDTTVDGKRLTPRQWIERFRDEIASQVVVGVYRASELATAQLFFAHVEHAHEAALIALADSVLQPQRGSPMLLELASHVADATFGPETLMAPLQLAYARAGEPLRYASDRLGRRRP